MFTLRDVVSETNGDADEANVSSPSPVSSSPRGWYEIAKGEFEMGCNPTSRSDCDASALTPRKVTLDAYRIDSTEVTVAQYKECVQEEGCTVDGLDSDPVNCNWTQPGRDQHPVNCVSWAQASAYCTWLGGALPTEAQWERAARGTDGRRYPWGDDEASCSHAVMSDDQGQGCGRNQTWHVGSKPQGASPIGALDMAGNVREWVADWWSPRVAAASHNPTGPRYGTLRVVRGGGWQGEVAPLRAYHRHRQDPDKGAVDIGFRCTRRIP